MNSVSVSAHLVVYANRIMGRAPVNNCSMVRALEPASNNHKLQKKEYICKINAFSRRLLGRSSPDHLVVITIESTTQSKVT